MATTELQGLFAEPILEQTYLDPGYSDHASDVWRVRTEREEVVVRIPRFARPGRANLWKWQASP